MTPDEKKLYALMAVAEQQQNLVNQAVKELQITEERIQKVIAGQNPQYRIKIAKYGLTGGYSRAYQDRQSTWTFKKLD